jgi:hypothetical protein
MLQQPSHPCCTPQISFVKTTPDTNTSVTSGIAQRLLVPGLHTCTHMQPWHHECRSMGIFDPAKLSI